MERRNLLVGRKEFPPTSEDSLIQDHDKCTEIMESYHLDLQTAASFDDKPDPMKCIETLQKIKQLLTPDIVHWLFHNNEGLIRTVKSLRGYSGSSDVSEAATEVHRMMRTQFLKSSPNQVTNSRGRKRKREARIELQRDENSVDRRIHVNEEYVVDQPSSSVLCPIVFNTPGAKRKESSEGEPRKSKRPRMKRQPRRSADQVSRIFCEKGVDQDGFKVEFISSTIGKGLKATREFTKGSFLVEYRGEHSIATETDSDDDENYMFFYKHSGKEMKINPESCLARYINDDHVNPNAKAKKMVFANKVHICIFALQHISEGHEIRYDYGETYYPWRQVDAEEHKVSHSCSEVHEGKPCSSNYDEICDPDCVEDSSDAAETGCEGGPLPFPPLYKAMKSSRSAPSAQHAAVAAPCSVALDTLPVASVSDVSDDGDPDYEEESCPDSDNSYEEEPVACGSQRQPFSRKTKTGNHQIADQGEPENLQSVDADISKDAVVADVPKDAVDADVPKDAVEADVPNNAETSCEGEPHPFAPLSRAMKSSWSAPSAHHTAVAASCSVALNTLPVASVSDVSDDGDPDYEEESCPDSDSSYEGEPVAFASQRQVPRKTRTGNHQNADQGDPEILQNADHRDPEILQNADQGDPETLHSVDADGPKDIQSNDAISSSTGQGVEVMITSNEGKRTWDKPQYCKFCLTPQKKLPRHMASQHADELEVQKWQATNNKTEKQSLYVKMRNHGNYIHNVRVLRENKGTLLVSYRPKFQVDPHSYVPCRSCLSFFPKESLWKHACKLKTEESKPEQSQSKKRRARRRVLKQSRSLLPVPHKVTEELREILSEGCSDTVGRLVKSDKLALACGERLALKHSHDADKNTYVRQKVRELGRVVLSYREVSKQENASLTDMISPKAYSDVVAATKAAAGFDRKTKLYSKPSLVLKVGYSLQTASVILEGEAVETGDKMLEEQCQQFQKLYKLKWEVEISTHALRTLREKKRNKPKLLPLTEDIAKLCKYLEHEAVTQRNLLSAEPTPKAWRCLAEVSLSQLVVFNRRRPGEVSKMKNEDYMNLTNESSGIFTTGLSNWEKELCKVFWRVEIVGKGENDVPLLVTEDMKESLDLLWKLRGEVGIPLTSSYFFANPEGSLHLRATDTIRTHAEACGAIYPENLRATKLRKHIAITSQIMNLKDNQLDILAKYMGHDIRTHRSYYRLPDSTLQVAKLGKVLLQLEKGNIKDLAGKSLDEIDVNSSDEVTDIEDNIGEEEKEKTHVRGRKQLAKETTAKAVCRDTTNTRKKPATVQTRRTWTDQEKSAIGTCSTLRKYLTSSNLPGKREISEIQCKTPALQGRTWKNIKDFIRNQQRKKDPLDFL